MPSPSLDDTFVVGRNGFCQRLMMEGWRDGAAPARSPLGPTSLSPKRLLSRMFSCVCVCVCPRERQRLTDNTPSSTADLTRSRCGPLREQLSPDYTVSLGDSPSNHFNPPRPFTGRSCPSAAPLLAPWSSASAHPPRPPYGVW